MILDIIKL